jgi:hypothetical protein
VHMKSRAWPAEHVLCHSVTDEFLFHERPEQDLAGELSS